MHSLQLILYCTFISLSSGLICLNCPSIVHPRFCQHVKQCGVEQVCGIERVTDIYEETTFKLGCFDQSVCSRKSILRSAVDPITPANKTCYECCNSDTCNTHGCGEPDFLQGYGIICYQCDGILKSEQCTKITFCNNREVCYIEEQARYGELFYHSGCIERHVCPSVQSSNIFGKRDVKRSDQHLKCCESSLCNNEYNSSALPYIPTYIPGHGGLTTSRPFMTLTPVNKPFPTAAICATNTSTLLPKCYNGGVCQTYSGNFRCICQDGYFGRNCQYTDSKGTKFILIFPATLNADNVNIRALVSSKQSGYLTRYYFSTHYNTSTQYSPINFEAYINKSVVMPKDGKFLAGVEITTSTKVLLYSFMFNNFSSEGSSAGYIALPVQFLSTVYIIPTYLATSYNGKSILTVSAIEDRTTVHVEVYGAPADFVLNKYETYEASSSYSWAGGLVKSSKPIVVVAGHACLTIGGSHCSPLLQMLFPVNQWDNVYVIPEIATRSTSIVRFYTRHDKTQTNISLHHGNVLENKQVATRKFLDYTHSTISFVQSDNDVMVMMFPNGLADGSGDTFMMHIPGINQYLPEYDFVVPPEFTSFLSIACRKEIISGFVLDGKPVRHANINHIFGGPDHYSTVTMSITTGRHHMTNTFNQRFGLWVYGNGLYDSYGYPAGIALKQEK